MADQPQPEDRREDIPASSDEKKNPQDESGQEDLQDSSAEKEKTAAENDDASSDQPRDVTKEDEASGDPRKILDALDKHHQEGGGAEQQRPVEDTPDPGNSEIQKNDDQLSTEPPGQRDVVVEVTPHQPAEEQADPHPEEKPQLSPGSSPAPSVSGVSQEPSDPEAMITEAMRRLDAVLAEIKQESPQEKESSHQQPEEAEEDKERSESPGDPKSQDQTGEQDVEDQA
ncbi:MAG: hypothetical protein ACLFPX_01885 [Candidatus Omnitrophota bacterium]